MAKRGHDGDAAPHGMGEPMMEMPLGMIDAGGLLPTLAMMQNLPAVASFAKSLADFVIETDRVDDLVQWMYNSMCEKHRSELPADRIEELINDHRGLLGAYLHSIGNDEACSHEKGHENG